VICFIEVPFKTDLTVHCTIAINSLALLNVYAKLTLVWHYIFVLHLFNKYLWILINVMSFSSLADFAEYFILLEIVAFQKKYESLVIVTYF
jgi:hypothetical protein